MTLVRDVPSGLWECMTKGCGYKTPDDDESVKHSLECDSGALERLMASDRAAAEARAQLGEYKRLVEAELARAIAGLHVLSAEAKEAQAAEALLAEDVADLLAQAAALRDAAKSALVMGGLPPDAV